jgi:hypothetical protein
MARKFSHGANGEDEDDLELELEPSRQREKRSRMGQPRTPRWEIVPAGTPAATCNGKRKGGRCEATVFFIERPRAGGREGTARVPIDCDPERVPTAYAPTADLDGLGVSHFTTCPDAGRF